MGGLNVPQETPRRTEYFDFIDLHGVPFILTISPLTTVLPVALPELSVMFLGMFLIAIESLE